VRHFVGLGFIKYISAIVGGGKTIHDATSIYSGVKISRRLLTWGVGRDACAHDLWLSASHTYTIPPAAVGGAALAKLLAFCSEGFGRHIYGGEHAAPLIVHLGFRAGARFGLWRGAGASLLPCLSRSRCVVCRSSFSPQHAISPAALASTGSRCDPLPKALPAPDAPP